MSKVHIYVYGAYEQEQETLVQLIWLINLCIILGRDEKAPHG